MYPLTLTVYNLANEANVTVHNEGDPIPVLEASQISKITVTNVQGRAINILEAGIVEFCADVSGTLVNKIFPHL